MLADRLRALGYAAPGTVSAIELDLSIGRTAASRLALLARWARHVRTLPVLFDDEDRRSLRVLLRGAAEGASPAARLAGVIPTPTLPRRTLETLATATSARDLTERLAASQHPFAPALARAFRGTGTGLLELEVALCKAFVERARRLTRWGPRHLRRWVAAVVDLENAWSVLLVEPPDTEQDEAALFVAGGERLSHDRFRAAIELTVLAARRSALADALGGTPVGAVFADATVPLIRVEERVLGAQIEEQRRAARLDPLGPAPILHYLLQLRAEAARLRRLVWRSTLGPLGDTAGPIGARR
jgi:vacuolar-type H+-ATPase subunit C/Vma6